jgi:putative phosphonate transport system ATP-binding protein
MKPVVAVNSLGKVYGPGCPSCDKGLAEPAAAGEGNVCPDCASVIGCAGITFELFDGEVLGVVGESGSGKSTLLKLLHFDEEPTRGEMRLRLERPHLQAWPELETALAGGENLFALNSFHKRMVRNLLMGIVYQSPHLGLKMKISSGGNIAERLLMANYRNVAGIRARAAELLEKTEVPVSRMDEPPSHFSGGMQQRVQIARALSVHPLLLFLDEPTTGLDLSVQARVLDLIKNLQREMGLTTIVVSHDLGIIKHLTTRTMVMKNGYVVEEGLTDQILEDPQHEFTQLLVNSTL